MVNPSWPFAPQWLSIREGLKESQVDPNLDGLFRPEMISGFMVAASEIETIKSPLSLFQVVPEGYLYENWSNIIKEVSTTIPYLKYILDDRKIIRISTKLFDNKNNCCDFFRKDQNGNGAQMCFDQESRMVLFYHQKLQKIHYDNSRGEYISTLQEICEEFNHSIIGNFEYSHSFVKVVTDDTNSYVYLTYRCSYSGFDEYLFPVIVSGCVAAVMLLGQCFNDECSPENLFVNRSDGPSCELKDLVYLRFSPSKIYDESILNNKRLKTLHRLSTMLGTRANDAIISLSQKYVSENFENIKREFYHSIEKLSISLNTFPFMEYKQILNLTLQKIFNTFDSEGFIRIYSIIPKVKCENKLLDTFELIGDSLCEEKNDDYRFLTFTKLSDDMRSLEGREIGEYLTSGYMGIIDRESTFRIEYSFIFDMTYVVWKKSGCWSYLYHDQFTLYIEALRYLYPTLLHPYIIIQGKELEDRFEKSIRIATHETDQVIPLIIDTIQVELVKEHSVFLSEIKDINAYNLLQSKVSDILSRVKVLDGLFKRSSLIFKETAPKFAWIDFHRIIYGIKSLIEKKAFESNKQCICVKLPKELSKCDVYTDENYLTQVLFNLVDNAIKYGLRGSQICVRVYLKYDCSTIGGLRELNNANSVCISVECYGDRIDDELQKNMYNLYYRGSEQKRRSDGLGVGLFLVKRLCESMDDCSIKFIPSQLWDRMNLVVYHYYKVQNGADIFDTVFPNRILSSYDEKELKHRIEASVNMNDNFDWKITPEEMKYLLDKKMYRNAFEVEIGINNIKYKSYDK